jgi:hypothetical protein
LDGATINDDLAEERFLLQFGKTNSSDRPPSIFTIFTVFSSEQQELLRLDAVELHFLRGHFGTN